MANKKNRKHLQPDSYPKKVAGHPAGGSPVGITKSACGGVASSMWEKPLPTRPQTSTPSRVPTERRLKKNEKKKGRDVKEKTWVKKGYRDPPFPGVGSKKKSLKEAHSTQANSPLTTRPRCPPSVEKEDHANFIGHTNVKKR